MMMQVWKIETSIINEQKYMTQPPLQPQPQNRWLKTAFIASIFVGGIAIYYTSSGPGP